MSRSLSHWSVKSSTKRAPFGSLSIRSTCECKTSGFNNVRFAASRESSSSGNDFQRKYDNRSANAKASGRGPGSVRKNKKSGEQRIALYA